MVSYLKLSDGTEFLIYACGSNRPVLVGFEGSELEKLLRLLPADKITFCGKEMEYAEAKRLMGGPFAAYIPELRDYMKIANHL